MNPPTNTSEEERIAWLRQLQFAAGQSDKEWRTALLLSVFLGFLGADMFYLDRMWLGALKLITIGGYGVWWIVDIVRLCRGTMRDGDGGLVRRRY